MYSHMNNSIYYHLFDSIVNTYLIEKCGQDPKSSPLIGLVVSSYCQVGCCVQVTRASNWPNEKDM